MNKRNLFKWLLACLVIASFLSVSFPTYAKAPTDPKPPIVTVPATGTWVVDEITRLNVLTIEEGATVAPLLKATVLR